MKIFDVTVIVEKHYSRIVHARNQKEAEKKAWALSIQDNEACYNGTEVMEPIVEELDKEGNLKG